MAKTPTTTKTAETEEPVVAAAETAPAPAAPAAPVEVEVRVAVDEFCTRKLDADPRAYAGLYAFQREEERAGRVLDTMQAYDARYTAMMNRHPKH